MSSSGKFALALLPARQRRGRDSTGARLLRRPERQLPRSGPAAAARISRVLWLAAQEFGAHAIIRMGKHGNLEWLPGKALALSPDCLPEAVLGPLPHIYPFIVNNPGKARRRAARPR